MEEKLKDIFVTYAWDKDNPTHQQKVFSLTNYLREQDFETEVDQMLSQKQTAIDFMQMMHKGMTDYKKVIVVLSKKYKEKAESFSGGVGTEYSLIIKDINTHPKKYILVCFEDIVDEIQPLSFKNREILVLEGKYKQQNINKLFAKLQDQELFSFAEVGGSKPIITPVEIPDFATTTKSPQHLEIVGVESKRGELFKSGGKYRWIKYLIYIDITNIGSVAVNDYSLDVTIPATLVDHSFNLEGRVQGEMKTFTLNSTSKLYPSRQAQLKFPIEIKSSGIYSVIESKMVLSLYHDNGSITNEYNIMDFIYGEDFGSKKQLKREDFED